MCLNFCIIMVFNVMRIFVCGVCFPFKLYCIQKNLAFLSRVFRSLIFVEKETDMTWPVNRLEIIVLKTVVYCMSWTFFTCLHIAGRQSAWAKMVCSEAMKAVSIRCVNIASVYCVPRQSQILQYELAVFLVSQTIAYKAGIWETLFTCTYI